MHESLRPGGWFLNLEHVTSADAFGENLFEEAMIQSLQFYAKSTGDARHPESIATEFREREDKEANILARMSTQLDWLSDIGFLHVDCYFKWYELAIFGGKKAPFET